jgi:hypothetical protein
MESQLTKRGSGRELAIVLHGPHGSPEKMQGVSKAIEERSEDIDILAPVLPYGGFLVCSGRLRSSKSSATSSRKLSRRSPAARGGATAVL